MRNLIKHFEALMPKVQHFMKQNLHNIKNIIRNISKFKLLILKWFLNNFTSGT